MFKYGDKPEEITMTSYRIIHLLPCNMKPNPVGAILKQVFVMFAKKYCSTTILLKAKQLLLSDDIVTRGVACIVNDQQKQRLCHSNNFVFCSMARDTLKDFIDTKQIPTQ